MIFRAGSGVGPPATEASLVPLRRALPLLLVMLGWVLFRSGTLGQAAGYLQALFSFDFGVGSGALAGVLTGRAVITLALASTVALLPRGFVLGPYLQQPTRRAVAARAAVGEPARQERPDRVVKPGAVQEDDERQR